ncbi:fasciclin domain family protein [Diplodia corticola]|uniref:Fasciclin domain family protein n=1 Tax=Diplodia corticola TaxID=236234 RepID=A0A1J9RWU9_9PEZI|nr:fasciclin domain family protein [Diplodia corticola]OJD31965.1 fasciclin domain family protein [Diplodia corticola]
MKFTGLLSLVALGSALVIPDEAILNELATQSESPDKLAHPDHPVDDPKGALEDLVDDTKDEFESVEFGLRDSFHGAKDVLDDALDRIVDAEDAVWEKVHESGFDMESWMRSGSSRHHRHFDLEGPPKPAPHGDHPPPPPHWGPPPSPPHGEHFPPPPPFHRNRDGKFPPPPPPFHRNHEGGELSPPPPPPHGEPPHQRPPHDGPPHHGPPHDGPPHDKPPHKGRPHHPPHHKPNQTVYELIANSKYTTKLAKLINDDDELVKLLNGTSANFTVFAPTDKAFDKIPKHGKEPTKEFIKKVLLYHVSPEFYPAGRVLHTHTIPTLYKEPALGGDDFAQRLSVNIGFKGLTLNFYSRIIAINIFGTNGVIHGLDTILVPPPKAADIISLLPGEFSTVTLGLEKTGLFDLLNSTDHAGGTFFAPSNWAFKKLGPRINAFLFSSYGEKYLKALLKYHIVPEQTLYSDAFYRPSKDDDEHSQDYFHVDLPTLLDDKALSVDVASHGPFTEIKVNGFSRVAIQNGIAKDGVIQVVSSVLIPPKTAETKGFWEGEHLSVEEFKARLEPFVDSGESEPESDAEELGWGEL